MPRNNKGWGTRRAGEKAHTAMGNLIVELRWPGSPLIHNVTDMLFLPGNCSRIRDASNRRDDYKPDGDAKTWSMARGPEIYLSSQARQPVCHIVQPHIQTVLDAARVRPHNPLMRRLADTGGSAALLRWFPSLHSRNGLPHRPFAGQLKKYFHRDHCLLRNLTSIRSV